jgi:UDP-2,4-diacetamido-2,4,6-trideoxy-beta-L-altropyranose hydrolase
MNKNVLIRADGSKKIGMGHLSRASLLSEMFRRRFGCDARVIVKENIAAQSFLAKCQLQTEIISADLSVDSEVDLLNNMIAKEKPLLVVFDLLTQEEKAGYLPAIRNNGSTTVAITDDSQRRELSADIVLNGNPSQAGLDYGEKASHYLIGPEYFIMDPNIEQVRKPSGRIENVLLTFGGSDHNDLVFKVLSAFEILSRQSKLCFKLAVSSACGYIDRLRDRLTSSDLRVELLVDINGFAKLWSQVDIAITAGGNTLFERIASRLPGATVCQLKRQMEIADKFESLGVNSNIGFGPNLSETELANRLEMFLNDSRRHLEQYNNAPKVTDGQGLNRLGDRLEPILKGG